MTMETYYRLLRPDENPSLGLFAKNQFSDVFSVEDHVTNGSKAGYDSRYISCCKTWEAVVDFAANTFTNPKRIVQITIKYPTIQRIDLTDPTKQMMYFPCNQKAINYVNRFQEVLILDKVPPDCLSAPVVLPS
ncbi:uncharacterized protein LOC133183966 [Saccostrea echinata]|uniref:uncharacterized protein LOC133183966 n=1 Tax=Saccostrea echinata TaxID=191078 RepID=UPI002A83E0AC|nr:uncharacterized protein LOC133183966 [Saccostrea echinata]